MQMVLSSDNECKQITRVIQIESRLLMYVGFVGSYELEEDDVRYKDDCEILHKAGFTEVKMTRLSKLPRNTAEEGRYMELVDYRRLQFIRWLVTTC